MQLSKNSLSMGTLLFLLSTTAQADVKLFQVNPSSNKTVKELKTNSQVTPNNVGIRATFSKNIASSAFFINGKRINKEFENKKPYSMFGDDDGKIKGGTLPGNAFTMVVKGYSGKNGTGRIVEQESFKLKGVGTTNPPKANTGSTSGSGNVAVTVSADTHRGKGAKLQIKDSKGVVLQSKEIKGRQTLKFNATGTLQFIFVEGSDVHTPPGGPNNDTNIYIEKVTVGGKTLALSKASMNKGDDWCKYNKKTSNRLELKCDGKAILALNGATGSNPPVTNPPKNQPNNPPSSPPVAGGGTFNPGASSGNICKTNNGVTSRGANYSSNVSLKGAYVPGDNGVDVVMTPKGAAVAVNSGSNGMIHMVNPTNASVNRTIQLNGTVRDLGYSEKLKQLVAATSKGVHRIDINSGKVVSTIGGDFKRVSIGNTGAVAMLSGKTAELYNPGGKRVMSKTINRNFVTDIALSDCGGSKNRFYVTSFRNDRFFNTARPQAGTNPVQIAALEAFDFSGKRVWQVFNHSNKNIQENVADTRLFDVTFGQDGYLYIAGETAGTASVFRWNGDSPLTKDEQFKHKNVHVTKVDNDKGRHTELFNSGAAHLTYIGRIDPTNGKIITSQLFMGRLSNGKANTVRVGDIAANANGSVYFSGDAKASIANRGGQKINGKSIGAYSGGDPTIMGLSGNFKNRHFWTALSARSGTQGMTTGIDANYGYVATVSNIKSGAAPVTRGSTSGKVHVSFTR